MPPPNKKNIQGDIWPRLPKKAETFYFFRITKPEVFKTHLSQLAPLLTTAEDAQRMREDIYRKKEAGTLKGLIKLSAINVAFSSKGLAKLGAEGFADDLFNNGQWQDMTHPGTGEDPKKHQGLDDQQDWYHQFKPRNGSVDGVFIVAGDSDQTVKKTIESLIEKIFNVGVAGQSLQRIFSQSGNVLPDDREHFGWVDGISQPVVIGLDDLTKAKSPNGLKPIPAGTILVGCDEDKTKYPGWAKEGSFMVYRVYEQRTPEFVMWCGANTPSVQTEGFSETAKKELRLFSSRVMGRWPDGAPLELYPDSDPSHILSADPHENYELLKKEWGDDFDRKYKEQEATNHTDNFNYNADDQTRCPFASHIRKCGPRDDHPFYTKHLMLRRGIPYGPLTTNNEKAGGVSQTERGLLFVSYQSNIKNGFHTVQKEWANTAEGPDDKTDQCGGKAPQGIDPIIGQVAPHCRHDEDPVIYNAPVPAVNLPDPRVPPPEINERTVPIQRWVIPHGGEYFFTPSISGIQDHLCKA
ncbi:Dyp-type peroxidase [Penicillium daleae]|uniref:Dyp-type peroxidase n=1 Tax=Penicillium daleae TaxID=63821 RepID=A0AAD6G686_9EURO|nr:Dyp-type peroxidase [Penicillium daleae]KAJ5461244.1 Dyp-type peroxidase [Penicillium daleae]